MTPRLPELTAALSALRVRAEDALARAMPAAEAAPIELHRAMRYAVLGGGKRLRALLVYATGRACGGRLEALDAPACAVEIIHAYSLVHDDLPAMDDDALRRGRPTCHVAFGEAMAILAGDALQALAFERMAQDLQSRVDAATRVEMLRVLAAACGSQGMAGGQAFDLGAVGRRISHAELERMHVHKTGALIRASVRLGALAAERADPSTLGALDRYAHCVGLAFQIRDDILDVEGDSAELGKTAGKDEAQAKPTYPALLGLDESHRLLAALTAEAITVVLERLTQNRDLVDLARFVADRTS